MTGFFLYLLLSLSYFTIIAYSYNSGPSVKYLSRDGLLMKNTKNSGQRRVSSFKQAEKLKIKPNHKKGHEENLDNRQSSKRKCGEHVIQHLLIHIIDPSDMDAQELIVGQLNSESFTVFSGKVMREEFPVDKLLMPIETVDDRCFAIRPTRSLPVIFCTGCINQRNRWINAIHETILCKKTKANGFLPEEPGVEMVAEAINLGQEKEPSGINLHIMHSPIGKPEIMINGVTVQEMEKKMEDQAVSSVEIKPQKPSIMDLVADVDDEPDEPENPINFQKKPRSIDEIRALRESEAEHDYIPANDPEVPMEGYEATSRGLYNRSLHT